MSSALSSTYRPLEKFEDHDDDLASSSASTDLFLADEHSIQTSSQRASKVVSWLIHGTLLTVSFSLFFFSIWREFHLDLICVNRHSTFCKLCPTLFPASKAEKFFQPQHLVLPCQFKPSNSTEHWNTVPYTVDLLVSRLMQHGSI